MVQANADICTPEMRRQFTAPDEPIMFEARVTKLSRYNVEQKRVLVLTGDHIYLFEKNSLNRRHRVTNMSAFIKSTVSSEIVLVFPSAKDCRITGLSEQQVTDLQAAVQMRYINKCPNKVLCIYGVPNRSLREFS